MTLNSCKKEDQLVRWLVKSVTNNYSGGDSETSNYTYDGDGRVTRIEYDSGVKIEISYSSSAMTINEFDSTGTNVVDTYTYPLNSEGFVTTAWGEDYNFDSDGHLISTSDTSGSSSTHTWVDGNRTQSIYTSGSYQSTTTYTYYDDKLESRDFGLKALEGTPSTNLVMSRSESQSGSSTTYVTDYSYEFDSKDRVTMETRTETSGGGSTYTSSSTYTYYD